MHSFQKEFIIDDFEIYEIDTHEFVLHASASQEGGLVRKLVDLKIACCRIPQLHSLLCRNVQ